MEFRKAGVVGRFLIVILLCSVIPSFAGTGDEGWEFSFTPYLWLPSINGTLKYSLPPGDTGSPDVETGANDYLTNLRVALMLAGEARKDRWSLFTDVIYLGFSSEDSTVKGVNFSGPGGLVTVPTDLNASTDSSLQGLVWTVAAGYGVVQTPTGRFDLFGGLRYLGLKASSDWQLTGTVTGPLGGTQVFPQSGSISQHETLWDGIVGVRGHVRLGESHWSAPYYLDIGIGSTSVTWQGLLGVAYGFSWGDTKLVYRHLSYDQKDDKFIQNMRVSGLALGVTFRF